MGRIAIVAFAVLVVAGCVMLAAPGPAIKDATTPTMQACRMGWYDSEYRYPHSTMIPVYPWQRGDPCAGIPPCGDPPRRGAGSPCDTLPIPAR